MTHHIDPPPTLFASLDGRVRPDRDGQRSAIAGMVRADLAAKGIRPGMIAASDHAERDCPGWNDNALAFLLAYAATHGEFIAEAVVAAHKAAGHPEPPTTRAWGGVVQGAAHRGEIVEVGFAPRSNGSPCKVWRRGEAA